ncbi:M48 family metallopeptidase [Xanthomarina gelatinilytica]|uniref:M48 family metallopeptidase n=2 Tax=Xanthomarina gelatinilytica TaxID=1137281 RepID=UPI003AA949DF
MFKSGQKQLLMHSINYGTKELFFELKQSERKSLAIEVYPDNSIKVLAPLKSTLPEIKKVVLKKSRWIIKQQNYFEQFLPKTPEREYVSGETHYYLGKGYLLKIRPGTENKVKLKGGCFNIEYCGENPQQITKNLLAKWYYQHAEKKFFYVAEGVFQKFKEFEIEQPILEIRRMSKRWGSCHKSGKISVNPEIIKAPTKCIEYVIIHEMCHLVQFNHNKEFYNLLSQKMPNWEKWKNRLEKNLS